MPRQLRAHLVIDDTLEDRICDFDDDTYEDFRELFGILRQLIAQRRSAQLATTPAVVRSSLMTLHAEYEPRLRQFVLVAINLNDDDPGSPGARAPQISPPNRRDNENPDKAKLAAISRAITLPDKKNFRDIKEVREAFYSRLLDTLSGLDMSSHPPDALNHSGT